MDACGVAGNRNVHAVVNNERHIVTVGHCLDLSRKLQIRAAARVLLAQLNERCAALAGLLDRVKQGFGGVVGAVRDDI